MPCSPTVPVRLNANCTQGILTFQARPLKTSLLKGNDDATSAQAFKSERVLASVRADLTRTRRRHHELHARPQEFQAAAGTRAQAARVSALALCVSCAHDSTSHLATAPVGERDEVFVQLCKQTNGHVDL